MDTGGGAEESMNYTVTFSCGHTCTIGLTGPGKERESKIKYYETHGLCPDCYAAIKKTQAQYGCDAVKMLYREYKAKYSDCKTDHDSYDADTKTITVYVPRVYAEEPTAEEAAEAKKINDFEGKKALVESGKSAAYEYWAMHEGIKKEDFIEALEWLCADRRDSQGHVKRTVVCCCGVLYKCYVAYIRGNHGEVVSIRNADGTKWDNTLPNARIEPDTKL